MPAAAGCGQSAKGDHIQLKITSSHGFAIKSRSEADHGTRLAPLSVARYRLLSFWCLQPPVMVMI
jgi:hypothetical protein